MDDTIWREIERAASRRFGLVTRKLVLEIGVSPSTVERRLRSGAWVALHPGVYRLGGVPESWEQAAMAACLAVGGSAVLSHRSAGRLWGMDVRPGDLIDVMAVRHAPHGRSELEKAADDAFARGLVSAASMERVLAERGRGVRGVSTLRTVQEPWVSGPPVDSVAERRLLRLLDESGLPVPRTRQRVHDGGRRVARLDLSWPDHRVVVEVDGYRWHCTREQFERDRERDLELTRIGWHVIRCSAASLVRDPQLVLAALTRLLGPPELRRSA